MEALKSQCEHQNCSQLVFITQKLLATICYILAAVTKKCFITLLSESQWRELSEKNTRAISLHKTKKKKKLRRKKIIDFSSLYFLAIKVNKVHILSCCVVCVYILLCYPLYLPCLLCQYFWLLYVLHEFSILLMCDVRRYEKPVSAVFVSVHTACIYNI